MEFGATFAYKRIDAQVEATLQEAAEILKNLEVRDVRENKLSSISSGIDDSSDLVSTTHESHQVISMSSIRRSSKEPRATIRTPRDANKSRKIFFPPAELGMKTTSMLISAVESPGNTDGSSIDPITSTPDLLFPRAIYIPAKQGSKINVSIGSSTSSRDSSCSSTKSVYRKHIEKLATEPLDDIKHLKCRGVKKSKPDNIFPKASYIAGTGNPKMAISPVTSSISTLESSHMSTTTSLVYKPMEFISADGRVKMLLQPLEEKMMKQQQQSNQSEQSTTEEFPIIPKQLQSSTKLKIDHRAKFSTKISIGNNTIDLAGIFNGNSMKKDLAKLVINGQSFST